MPTTIRLARFNGLQAMGGSRDWVARTKCERCSERQENFQTTSLKLD